MPFHRDGRDKPGHDEAKVNSFRSGRCAAPVSHRTCEPARRYCVCLKYDRSGGAWFFLDGISLPSALR